MGIYYLHDENNLILKHSDINLKYFNGENFGDKMVDFSLYTRKEILSNIFMLLSSIMTKVSNTQKKLTPTMLQVCFYYPTFR